MSMVTAVKYLAVTAADYLMPWEPSREKAAVMLADLPLMRKLREEDEATADEVTFLVLGRFLPGEPPSVEGKDHLSTARTCHMPDCPNSVGIRSWFLCDAHVDAERSVAR